MKHISPPPRIQIIDSDGYPAEDWKIYTYEAGTTTPLATYTDSTGSTPNTNPVVLDANGSASIWLNNQFYKYVVKDADDVTVWTIDNVGWGYIFQENNTWTGTNTFDGEVTFNNDINGDLNFTGAMTVQGNFHTVGNFTVDGTAAVNDLTADTVTTPIITFSSGETLSVTTEVITLGGNKNIVILTDVGGTPRTFDFREDGLLRLPVETPVNDLDAASKGYVDDTINAALGTGLIPVAAGAVVTNLLVSGAVGVTSVNHSATGTYVITLASATSTVGKTICMTTIRDQSPVLTRNYTAIPYVDSTTQITVRTGGGNSWGIGDLDFNFVVYSLP